ncbi:membrane protein [Phytophthora palmivora]|uniref:Membrane protein n=1 Tax=Phytophthora palmivora TaxID=4796 RepID=A0A2P4XJC8_9STRA|nr:membrane protein [Phytophthora palmivora]
MMLRGGMRYLCVYHSVTQRGSVSFVARSLSSMAPNSSINRVSWSQSTRPIRAEAVAATSQDSKESEPLTRGEQTSSSPVQDEDDVEKELGQPTDDIQRQSWRQRAKNFAIEYGRVGICTHIVLSLLSFSVIYVGVSSGVDVKAILNSVGLSTSISDSTTNSAGSFLIAYTLYKVLAPVRWPLTFAVTPVVLRALRRRGYMLAATNSSSSRSPPSQ